MSNNVYIARQPILNLDNTIYGYELLFRSLHEDGSIMPGFDDDMLATTRVVVNALNHIGMKDLVGEHFAFINIDEELLLDDIIFTIPKDRFILELLEHIEIHEETLARIIELKKMGYILALDDAHCAPKFIEQFQQIFPYLDILKLDVSLVDTKALDKRFSELQNYNFTLLAEKVETREQFEYFKSIGCKLFQGYYFAKPDIIQKSKLEPAYKNIFQLINLLDKDVSVEEISIAFETHPEITIQLLRFMNSGLLGLRSQIRSIKHAVTLIGKPPLKQWLLLIAFSKSQDGGRSYNSPLITLALSRSRLMAELMKKYAHSRLNAHEAALVGILSLIDVITQTSMDIVLAEIEIDDELKKAILTHEGDLGALLDLAISIEHFDIPKANSLMDKLKLSHHALEAALFKVPPV